MYFRNSKNQVIGSICINTDISDSIKFENFLKEYNSYNGNETQQTEIFVSEVGQLLEHLLLEGQREIGKPVCIMSRDEKIQFIKHIDNKGAYF